MSIKLKLEYLLRLIYLLKLVTPKLLQQQIILMRDMAKLQILLNKIYLSRILRMDNLLLRMDNHLLRMGNLLFRMDNLLLRMDNL